MKEDWDQDRKKPATPPREKAGNREKVTHFVMLVFTEGPFSYLIVKW